MLYGRSTTQKTAYFLGASTLDHKNGHNSVNFNPRATRLLFLERKLNFAYFATFSGGLRFFNLSQNLRIFLFLRMSQRDFLLTQQFFILYFFSQVISPKTDESEFKFRVLPFTWYIITYGGKGRWAVGGEIKRHTQIEVRKRSFSNLSRC